MYYLDSNAFIYPALYEGPKASGAAALLAAVVEGDESAATASLTLPEVLWIVSQNASREEAIAQGERLLHLPNLRILDVGGREMLRVIKFMDAYEGLTPRDAIHLSTAIESGIRTIVTDDADFDVVSEVERIGLDELDVLDHDSA